MKTTTTKIYKAFLYTSTQITWIKDKIKQQYKKINRLNNVLLNTHLQLVNTLQ